MLVHGLPLVYWDDGSRGWWAVAQSTSHLLDDKLDDIDKTPRIGRQVILLLKPKFSQVIIGYRFGFIKITVTGEVSLAPTF